MELSELVEKGLQSEDKLIQEFVTGIQWIRLMRMVKSSGLRTSRLDRLGIPLNGFMEAYETLTKAGMSEDDAFIEAALQQFEKRLPKDK